MHDSASPRTKPCDRRMPRCGQRSAHATRRPVALRQSASSIPSTHTGITPSRVRSRASATGVQAVAIRSVPSRGLRVMLCRLRMTVLPERLAWAVAKRNRASCLIVRLERPISNQFVSGATSRDLSVLQTPPSDYFDPDVDRTKRNAQVHGIDQVCWPAQGDFHVPVGTPRGNPTKP